MNRQLLATLDIGKTHTRIALIEPRSCSEIWSARRVNERRETPLGWQLDVAGIERWLVETFRSVPDRNQIAAIIPVAHGAACVMLNANKQKIAAPDYEDPRFESVSEEYEAERDPFEQTYSPGLPLGLNLGRQLFYFQTQQSERFVETSHILPYAQFWAWRLSDVMASEVTSLGCHTDLWRPLARACSSLAERKGWSERLPARRYAGDVLGTARGDLAKAAEIPEGCRIVCGLHDSNASYLRYLNGRRDRPFVAISSGTWTVLMASQARLSALNPMRDMLANVDAFGAPVATARFMGGREYAVLAGSSLPATPKSLQRVLDSNTMALPSFAKGGPYATSPGCILNAEGIATEDHAALGTLYVALMSNLLLDFLRAEGEVIVDGPLASNELFGAVLASLRPSHAVLLDTGDHAAAALCTLAGFPQDREPSLRRVEPLRTPSLADYALRWREHLPAI